MDRREISATELVNIRLSPDRKCLLLCLREQSGQTVVLSLPASWLNAMQNVMPREIESGTVHSLDSWSMDRTVNGQELILTLRTPEGLAVSFTAKPWQVEGMATIATYGSSAAKTFH